MDKTTLEKLFVGREKLLESLLKEIENASRKKTPRFYLIVGPRGIGKSHLLVLLYYEIQNKLSSLLIPIKLAEEEYSVFRVSDLFLRILEEKSENTSEILSFEQEDEILHAALEKIKQISKAEGKRYAIFIENLHELFRQLDTEELKKLRSIFQKNDFFSILSTAPMIFPGISDHEEPFYNFFNVIHLGEFSLTEIKELIKKVAEVEENKKFLEEFEKYEPKIHGMSHLTGGSPRLVILFYEMVTKGELENIEKAFLKIIDEHTPYYQEIFQLLPMQRRRIFDILISFGSPITPKQISNKARIDLPTVTTQLRRLEKDGYIISRPMGRHTYYEVRERLFRLWREMRQPFGRKRVSALLEFLQLWYTPDERKDLFKTKFELLEAGEKTVLRELCYYAEILPLEFKPDALLKLTTKLLELGEFEEAKYEIRKLKETAVQIKDRKLEGKITMYEAQLLFSEERYEEALQALNRILEQNPKDEIALANKGVTLGFLGKHEEALMAFNRALEFYPENDDTLSNKGVTLRFLERYEESLEAFNKALEINPKNEFALSQKGSELGSLGRHEEALEAFNKALEINPENEFALSRKGIALRALGRYEEALEAFNKALEINPEDQFVLTKKGIVLVTLGKYEEGLDNFNRALEIKPNDIITLLEKGHTFGCLLNRNEEALSIFNKVLEVNPLNDDALSHKAFTLAKLGKYEEALEAFKKALEINPKNECTFSKKGVVLGNLGRYDEALEAFNNALEIAPKYVFALLKKGVVLRNLGRDEEALEAFKKTLDIFPNYEDALTNFVDVSMNLAVSELTAANRGNAIRLLEMAINKGVALKAGTVAALIMNFVKKAAETKQIPIIKAAVDEVMRLRGDEYRELLMPITKAMEIIETQDIQKYYSLQVEEREVVADIVKMITRSDELLPDEIKRKEGLKPS
jgi:tetratricopeptide (TPR) repeat protein